MNGVPSFEFVEDTRARSPIFWGFFGLWHVNLILTLDRFVSMPQNWKLSEHLIELKKNYFEVLYFEVSECSSFKQNNFFVMYLPSFRNSSSASAFSDVFEDIFCMNFWFSYNNDD